MGDWRNQDFRGSDHAQSGSVKLLEDADSIGYDPDTKHLYVTNGGGEAHLVFWDERTAIRSAVNPRD
jgi:DNA-binding beta-propeller fold protein YncE